MLKKMIKNSKNSVFLYFVLSTTILKQLKIFLFLDFYFLVLLPFILIFDFFNKKRTIEKKEIFIISSFLLYVLNCLLFYNEKLHELLYFLPNLTLYLTFRRSNKTQFKKSMKIFSNLSIGLGCIGIMIYLLKLKYSLLGMPLGVVKFGILNVIFNHPVTGGTFFSIAFIITDLLKGSYIGLGIILLNIIFTKTRGALLLVIIYFLISKSNYIIRFIKIIFLSIVTLFVIEMSGFFSFSSFFLEKYSGKNLDITTGRSKLWGLSYEKFKENPILGVGHSNLIENLSDYGLPGNLHNTYLDFLFSTGIVSFILILIFLILSIFQMMKKKNRKYRIKEISIVLSLLIMGGYESNLFFTRLPTSALFWLILSQFSLKKEMKYRKEVRKIGKKNIPRSLY